LHYHSNFNAGFDPGVILMASEFTRKGVTAKRAPMRRSVIVPPLIDTSRYEKIKRPVIAGRCCIGRVSSQLNWKYPKVLPEILKAVAVQVPDATFSIVGGSKYYPEHDVPRLAFPQPVWSGVEQLYTDLDIFVHVTDPPHETWGRAVTEAMAAGLPCVVENKGAMAEQIDNGVNGFLCKSRDEFISSIVMLARNEKLRIAMGTQARRKALQQFGLRNLRAALNEALVAALGA
jgi:glycosyltransferase involved in cell wall biosynthesis